MKYRKFGRKQWQVSEIGYGMWGMAGWTGSDDDESMESLQLALDMGCNFFDTAWAYGSGKSEKFLGDLIRANKGKQIYTATKIPPGNFKWPARREYGVEECFPPGHIEDYVTRSLKNASLESYDLMQLHTWEDSWLNDDKWLKKMEELRSQGYFKAIGISLNRWEPWNGIKAVESGVIDTVQVVYNIFDQNPEDELFPACIRHDVAVIVRVPFDEGGLTGNLAKSSKWPDGDFRNRYFSGDNLVNTVERAEELKTLIPEGMTMAEMALRFILAQPAVTTIIPGMRKQDHVRSNLSVSEAGHLEQSLIGDLRKHRWDRKP